jgi:hypothetical protein
MSTRFSLAAEHDLSEALIVPIGHLHREPGHWREQGEK